MTCALLCVIRRSIFRPSLVVTDFAGTRLRDDLTVLSAYRSVLSAHQIPFTEADLTGRRGASKRAVFEYCSIHST